MAAQILKTATVLLAISCGLSQSILQGQESGSKENDAGNNDINLNDCINVQRTADAGYCLSKEFLRKLNKFDEAESFSLVKGIDFVRDEKTPRDFASFLDKDPMDLRSIMEDASNLISKRSLQWDLSRIYPGLMMKIGPTLANGVLEFVVDQRLKDRTYQNGNLGNGEMSTGRLLARSLLVPFLLGFKFQLSTLLPLLLGLILIASKKAFFLAKIALLAGTVFGSGGLSGLSGFNNPVTVPTFNEFTSPALSHYTSAYEHPGFGSGNHGSGGHFHHRPHHSDFFYREKSSLEQTTATPITPDELRDRFERLFVTKKEAEEPREDNQLRHSRKYTWTPISG